MIGILLLVFNDCQLKMKTVSEISENYIEEAALHTKYRDTENIDAAQKNS